MSTPPRIRRLRYRGHDADTGQLLKGAFSQPADGRNVACADVEDANFWHGLDLGDVEVALLAMDDIEAKLTAARQLREAGFAGRIVAHALYDDHVAWIHDAGADQTYLTMHEAGVGLAEHAWEAMGPPGGGASSTATLCSRPDRTAS